jgi:hypothetical protein
MSVIIGEIYHLWGGEVNGCRGKKIKLSVCYFLTDHHATKAYWGSGGIDPCVLDLGTRWR